jgi:stearoyl-CoA desaturase (delta-9 desaturase)
VNRISSIPFVLVHLVPLAIFWTGITWREVVLCAVLYATRMFFITAGYHRYFAHRTYKMNRFWQLAMALGGTTALQKGPLWWAALHRDHHRFADTPADIHSPLKGFWWSHVGWILCDKYSETRFDRIRDFARFPELRWVNKQNWIGPWSLGIATFLLFGVRGLVAGFFLSTVLLWHGTFLVNSLAHVFGRRRYATHDSSRNSLLIALVTGGEGWHNNHHYLPSSSRQGFFWWQVDFTYYALVGLSALGIVRDLHRPPARLLHVNLVPVRGAAAGLPGVRV